jgi:chemotaxis signal transduction protein
VIDGAAANQALGALVDAAAAGPTEAEATEASTAPAQTLLVLRAGSRWFALPATAVREVVLKSFITRIPHAPPQVLGVALIRGRLLPVVSLEVLLQAVGEVAVAATLPRLVVLETEQVEAALVADEVHGIVDFASASLKDQSTPAARPAWVTAEIAWERRLLCILQLERLLAAAIGAEEQR